MARTSRGRSSGGKGTQFTGRSLSQKVRTAKGRKNSSTRWLKRQLNDPYVAEARARGYRSRAAFKLLELNDSFHLIKPGDRVVDLGAAPGGWTQVALELIAAKRNNADAGTVLAVDIQEMEPIPGATILHQDFLDPAAPDIIRDALDGPANVVLSDMAAPATGHPQTDHLRIIGLCEAAFEFACDVLAPGGVFAAKVLQGGTENTLLTSMKKRFKTVRHAKPPASRSDSAEMYVLALGFKGLEKSE